ncbi:MAG TPA: hypothetical protein VFJ90_08845, partial [Candidatus Didemnitutus sp.]|nr:hypothetical protein [Candidatus Didemnitutus sp.]
MKRTACAALFVAATALCMAADSDEPLAGVKQELKQLQSDSTAQKNGGVDPKLKTALPALTLPSTAPAVLDPNASPRRQSE